MANAPASIDLLKKAAARLGVDEIARTLAIPSDALAKFMNGERQMTLPQQRTLALAVLLLSEGHEDLRRRAKALLSQVRAATDFQTGVTECHPNPPSSVGWY
jgi:hypothetical protein